MTIQAARRGNIFSRAIGGIRNAVRRFTGGGGGGRSAGT